VKVRTVIQSENIYFEDAVLYEAASIKKHIAPIHPGIMMLTVLSPAQQSYPQQINFGS